MILTSEEQKIILDHRERKAQIQALQTKRKMCVHDFRYVGHSHNDDAYECKICGEMEFQ